MVFAVAGQDAGSVVGAADLVPAGTRDDGGIEIDQVGVRRAVRIVTGHAGGHPDMLGVARPRCVDEIVAFEAERGVAGVGADVGKTQHSFQQRLVG